MTDLDPAADPQPDPQSFAPLPEPPRRDEGADAFWNYTDLALFVGMAIPCILLGSLAVQGLLRLLHWNTSVQVFELLPAQLLGYLILFSLLRLLLHMEYDRPFWQSLGWRGFRIPGAWIVLSGVLAAIGVSVAAALIGAPQKETPMMALLENRRAVMLMAAFGVTLAPLFEELGFRGFLQPLLVRSLGVGPGIVLTAIPFGLLHYKQYGSAWQYVIVISLAGATFGWMRHVTGSTRASALMHASYNAFFFLVMYGTGKDLPQQW